MKSGIESASKNGRMRTYEAGTGCLPLWAVHMCRGDLMLNVL